MAPEPHAPPDTPYAAFAFDPQAAVVGQGGGEGHAPGETTDLREKKRRAPLGSRRLRLASPMPGSLGFRAITNTLGNQRSKNGAGCPSFGPAGSHARASHRSPPRQMAANSRREHSHPTSAAIRGRVKVKLAENFRNECSQRELAARNWEAGGSGSLPPWETPSGPGWRRTSSNREALTSVSRCHRRERLGEGDVDQTSTRARGVPVGWRRAGAVPPGPSPRARWGRLVKFDAFRLC